MQLVGAPKVDDSTHTVVEQSGLRHGWHTVQTVGA